MTLLLVLSTLISAQESPDARLREMGEAVARAIEVNSCDEALRRARGMIALAEDRPEGYRARGDALVCKGEDRDAIAAYEEAIDRGDRSARQIVAHLLDGFATVVLGPWEGELSVRVQDRRESLDATDPGPVPVAPGKVKVVVRGERGEVTEEVTASVDDPVRVDVASLNPCQLTLEGVPAGSVVRVAGEQIAVGWEQGWPSDVYGLNVEERVVVDGLRPGTQFWSIQHPVLGGFEGEFPVAGGADAVVQTGWESSAAAAALRREYAAYEEALAEAERTTAPGRHKGLGLTGLGVGGALVAIAGTSAVLALSAQADLDPLDQDYEDALTKGDVDTGLAVWQSRESTRDSRNLWTAVGAGSGIAGGLGLGFGVVQLGISSAQKRSIPTWDPAGLELPIVPAGAAEVEVSP